MHYFSFFFSGEQAPKPTSFATCKFSHMSKKSDQYPPCQIRFTRVHFNPLNTSNVYLFSIFYRNNMSRDATTERNRSSENELPTGSTTNTRMFLDTCVLDADHKALEEHLVNNPVQQSDLDKCLLRGLQIVQRKEQELSDVAPALTLLLQSGAK